MAAAVIDALEAVQIQVAQHVGAVAATRDVRGILQPALEVAAIEQPGQRIVRRLIRHLPRQTAHFRHIVQQYHHANALAGFHADRRRRRQAAR